MRALLCLVVSLGAPVTLPAQDSSHRALERAILEQLVEINTSDSARRTGEAAQSVARRLVAAGIPPRDVRVLALTPGYHTLVARFRGRDGGRKPILLMAHLDVVPARREDWSFDPFEFRELGGYYYGRGTADNKAGVAMLVANLIRYKREGFVPDRDLVLVLTADEETSGNSIRALLQQHRDLVDAEFALNTDAGGGELRDSKATAFTVQTAEKAYLSFRLQVRSKGGHSSLPEPDNAIYRLSDGLGRLARFTFPVRLNQTTRAYFERAAAAQPDAVARDMRALANAGDPAAARRLSAVPYYNAIMRTTCVATRLSAGHADNALPQLAEAVVNCRVLPGDSADTVEATLRHVLADSAVRITRASTFTVAPPSPLRLDVMQPIERLVARLWPGAVVVPQMSAGASDGVYVRNAGIPTYGVSALFAPVDDVRRHGRDERVAVEAYHDAANFWYALVKALTSERGGA